MSYYTRRQCCGGVLALCRVSGVLMMGDIRCGRVRTTMWWRQRRQRVHFSFRWTSWILLLLRGLTGETWRTWPSWIMNRGTQRLGAFRNAYLRNCELFLLRPIETWAGTVLTSNAVDQTGAGYSSAIGTFSIWRIQHVWCPCPGPNNRRVGA